MSSYYVDVTQTVKVTVDESKFTEEWMASFRESFYEFDQVEDHLKHLAQLYARGVVTQFSTFIEGYGKPEDMGIEFRIVDTEIEQPVGAD